MVFDYRRELRTNQALVVGMHAFFAKLGIASPIFIGASDGGMVAQIYTQKYPNEVGGLVLVSTGGKDFQQAKDVHITGLLADLMNQTPVTKADFRALKGRILLIFPNQDFFSDQMQQDLIKLMQDPQIVYVSGGHLGTVLKAGDYVREIKKFLEGME